MKQSHLNLLVPQWQGGGQDLSTYNGGLELKDNYLHGLELAEVEISIENVNGSKEPLHRNEGATAQPYE